MLFTVVGCIISILGFTSGLIAASKTGNNFFLLYIWTGTFLFALIYFGIGMILKNQKQILGIIAPQEINRSQNSSYQSDYTVLMQQQYDSSGNSHDTGVSADFENCSNLEKLEYYKKLYDDKKISKEEFIEMRKLLIGQ